MKTDTSMNGQKDTLRAFLQEEVEDAQQSLEKLKGSVKAADYIALGEELNERSTTLASLTDDDDTQLFLLRREIEALKQKMEALATRQNWWSGLPTSFWIALVTSIFILYFAWLAILQWRGSSRDLIYDYPATLTATALQAEAPSFTGTPTPTPTAIP